MLEPTTPYDLLIVPGYTPDDGEQPLARVHPIAAARLDEAIALYRAGKARIILVAGGNVHPVGTPYPEAISMKVYLLRHGLPESAIVVEPCARHSTTNLRNAGRFMLKYHLRTALVVTSADQAFYFGNENLTTFAPRSNRPARVRGGAPEEPHRDDPRVCAEQRGASARPRSARSLRAQVRSRSV